MVLAVHPSHRFAGLDERRRRPSSTASRSSASIPTCRSAGRSTASCGTMRSRFDVVLEFDNIENIKRAVEIPSGVSILPEPSLAQEVKAGTLVAVRDRGQDSATA